MKTIRQRQRLINFPTVIQHMVELDDCDRIHPVHRPNPQYGGYRNLNADDTKNSDNDLYLNGWYTAV